MNKLFNGLLLAIFAFSCASLSAKRIDLSNAVILQRQHVEGAAEKNAPQVLSDEMERRTGVRLQTSTTWVTDKPVIALTSQVKSGWNREIPFRDASDNPENQKEGYRIFVESKSGQAPVVWVIGNDSRSVLFGVGELIRRMEWGRGAISIDDDIDYASAPQYEIRGHQIGYRNTANSWDAWTKEQMEQYMLDQVLFGCNSIENIPFHDRPSPVFKYTREDMNAFMSQVCEKYEIDHWDWTPAEFDLKDQKLRADYIKEFENYFKTQARLDALFFPGGDPGHNDPDLVFAVMKDIYDIGVKKFPKLQIWMSLQGFDKKQQEWTFNYLSTEKPTWFTGVVNGPQSPNIAIEKQRLPAQYKLRTYPDLTHNKLCQYQVPWWDQAYSITLGREATNPRPEQYKYIHNWFAPFSNGIISYSDGVHDDVNKVVFSDLSWNPKKSVRDICRDYARFFFNTACSEVAADAILALENNWRGTLSSNGAVNGTLLIWQSLEKQQPELLKNWRFQQLLMRAYYDKYVRDRYINEEELEGRANKVLVNADKLGSQKTIEMVQAILAEADKSVNPTIQKRIFDLCEDLWQSVQLQTHVEKYQASGSERGAVLEFVDRPVNNRWWIEDELKKAAAMKDERAKVAHLKTIGAWEDPGLGGYYNDIGNRHKSDNVLHADFTYTQPGETYQPEPLYWWKENGFSRERLSWQITMDYPQSVVFEALSPNGEYQLEMTGRGQFLLKINGQSVQPTNPGRRLPGEKAIFKVDKSMLNGGKIVLTWDHPTDEGHLNWRERSYLAELWLRKIK